tara:strand:- start:623 stop:1786 length:1164 start_codon:yes stop_codon:yes gene_type:complete
MSKIENDEIEIWDDLIDIKEDLLRGIYNYGFEKPSPIQKKAIIPILKKTDLIAQAQSGTGKTGCFVIGVLQLIDVSLNETQCIILTPTRELSLQIKKVIDSIGNMIKQLKTQLLIGGVNIEHDIKDLKKTPHIIIGCPGRVYDMLMRKKIIIKKLKIFVIDEADEMFSYGFKDQIYNIFQFLPSGIQFALFSATMPPSIENLIVNIMKNPKKILVKAEQLTLEGIEQYYIALENDESKYSALKDLYGLYSVSQCIIYCNSVKRVEHLYNCMTEDNFPVSQIHSNMEKNERTESYNDFVNGKTRVLISSNVTSRGIDLQQVSIVINYDIPNCQHNYLHRIGRSGRWGRKGMGINFVTRRDIGIMKEIEKFYATEIKELPNDIVEKNNC